MCPPSKREKFFKNCPDSVVIEDLKALEYEAEKFSREHDGVIHYYKEVKMKNGGKKYGFEDSYPPTDKSDPSTIFKGYGTFVSRKSGLVPNKLIFDIQEFKTLQNKNLLFRTRIRVNTYRIDELSNPEEVLDERIDLVDKMYEGVWNFIGDNSDEICKMYKKGEGMLENRMCEFRRKRVVYAEVGENGALEMGVRGKPGCVPEFSIQFKNAKTLRARV